MEGTLTDVNGAKRRNAVNQGLVSPSAWENIKALGRSILPPPFPELLGKTEKPFVTKINEAICTTPSFHDGH